MSKILSFKNKENKHDVYRGKDCMKTFCESLREHGIKIILAQFQQMSKYSIFVKKRLKINMPKPKNIVKLGVIVFTLAKLEVLHIANKI